MENVLLTLLAGFAGVASGLAWGFSRRQSGPTVNLEAALAKLETERAKDRLEMAAFIEEAAGIGETVKRHRHRIDGVEGARAKREAQQLEMQPQVPLSPEQQREAIRARARASGRL